MCTLLLCALGLVLYSNTFRTRSKGIALFAHHKKLLTFGESKYAAAQQPALSRTPALLLENWSHSYYHSELQPCLAKLTGIIKSSGSTGTIDSCTLRVLIMFDMICQCLAVRSCHLQKNNCPFFVSLAVSSAVRRMHFLLLHGGLKRKKSFFRFLEPSALSSASPTAVHHVPVYL